MKPIVAVIGDSKIRSGETSKGHLAFELGQRLVDEGFRIQTGGLGGIMEKVFQGAKASLHYKEGATIAIVPSFNSGEANSYADIVIPTGLDLFRNGIVVNSDAVIALGGGAGTLSEIAFAWQLFKLIIAFDNVGGWSAKLADTKIDDRQRYADIDDDRIYKVSSVDECINVLKTYIGKYTRVHTGIKKRI